MGTGEQLRLQANFGNQLRWQLQMTPATDTLLQLRYDPSPMLRCDFLILLVELRIQMSDRALPSLLLSRYSALQKYLLLLELLLLLCELLQCCLDTVLLHSRGLTLLISRFHERQELVFEYLEALLA